VQNPKSMNIPIALDDPFGALHQLADIISDKLMAVPWDFDVFGRGIDIPLYLHKQDVLEPASVREKLDITLIRL